MSLEIDNFITDFYQYALTHMPALSELQYWVSVLEASPDFAGARQFIHEVFDGLEYRHRPLTPWSHTIALYQTILGREPELAGLEYWAYAVLGRFSSLRPLFLQSEEFRSRVANCLDPGIIEPLVLGLYVEALMRTPSDDERRWWTDYMVGRCREVGMMAVTEAVEVFFTSPKYLSVPKSHTQYVTILYQALLGRDPEPAGLEWWVTYLVGQLAVIEEEFLDSREFQGRFTRLFPEAMKAIIPLQDTVQIRF